MKVNLIKQKQQSLCNWNSCNLKIIYIVQIRWSHQNFLSNSLIKTPITGTHLIPKIIYFWSCNSNFVKKYSHRILFFEIIFFDFFLNETRLSGRRTQVQNKLYQTLNFRFVDTRRSFLLLLISDFEFALADLCLNLLQHMMQNWTCYYPAWNKK